MVKIQTREAFAEGPVVKTPGNSILIKTGTWRSARPVWLKRNCSNCLYCWLYCPDMAVNVSAGKMEGVNYDYCKGCGICAMECPGRKGQKAIVMEKEDK